MNRSTTGKWVHLAKIGFEKFVIRKLHQRTSEPYCGKAAMQLPGIK